MIKNKIIDYPAMASPASTDIVGNLLEEYLSSNSFVLDPYCGTGRLLIKPRELGHNVLGIDCSPIAILASRVLHCRISHKLLFYYFTKVEQQARLSRVEHICTDEELFWFNRNSYIDLYNILLAIESIDMPKPILRALWLALSICSRKVSYARDSEYKLHRMNHKLRSELNPNTLNVFHNTLITLSAKLDYIQGKRFPGKYRFLQSDVAKLSSKYFHNKIDAIVTSPPYGDSKTTVGYGQFAKVPLILLSKSFKFSDEFTLITKGNFDTHCLGGTKCQPMPFTHPYPSIIDFELSRPMLRFTTDYFNRLYLLSTFLKTNGLISLILGDRLHNSRRYPLIDATCSYFKSLGFKEIFRHERLLSHKRLPRTMIHQYRSKELTHDSMNYETIVCFQN